VCSYPSLLTIESQPRVRLTPQLIFHLKQCARRHGKAAVARLFAELEWWDR
jgi:hypothetical protein